MKRVSAVIQTPRHQSRVEVLGAFRTYSETVLVFEDGTKVYIENAPLKALVNARVSTLGIGEIEEAA